MGSETRSMLLLKEWNYLLCPIWDAVLSLVSIQFHVYCQSASYFKWQLNNG